LQLKVKIRCSTILNVSVVDFEQSDSINYIRPARAPAVEQNCCEKLALATGTRDNRVWMSKLAAEDSAFLNLKKLFMTAIHGRRGGRSVKVESQCRDVIFTRVALDKVAMLCLLNIARCHQKLEALSLRKEDSREGTNNLIIIYIKKQ
jgi:hypothetical protein